MHIAVLMTNTDESDFAQRHPKDGEKFAALITSVDTDWKTTSFNVKDGIFPESLDKFDGIVITGSPASARDDAAWIKRLNALIVDAFRPSKPMFGACFGHQAIASALGGSIDYNPAGWVFGLTETDVVASPDWAAGLGPKLRQYAAHKEQVTALPEGAEVILSSPVCPNAGFIIDERVYTTQNHPEMSHDFITALVDEFADDLGPSVAQTARASLSQSADTEVYAHTIAQFFENAHAN